MNYADFDQFCTRVKPEIANYLVALKSDIDHDMFDPEDPDRIPYLAITISCNDKLETWSIQTGDNSFTGSCYGDPYWGTGNLFKNSKCNDLATELLESLSEVIEFDNDAQQTA